MAKTPIFRKLRSLLRDAKIAHSRRMSEADMGEQRQRNLEQSSRREFLKTGAAAAAGAVAATSLVLPSRYANAAVTADTVAILGAGAAGLAAAYNLKRAGIPFHIFEGQTRVGGRIWTSRNFNKDGQSVELGGELVDTPHLILRALSKELLGDTGIQRYAPGDSGFQDDLFHSNGRTYSHAEIIASLQPFLDNVNAAIDELWVGAGPLDYLTYDNADKIVNMRKFDNLPLYEFIYSTKMLKTVDRFILDFINVAYLTEYGRETQEQPSINLLYLVGTEIVKGEFELFGLSDEALCVRGGTDRLTQAMYNSLTNNGAKAADLFSLGQKLTRIRRDQSGKFFLSFNGRSKESIGFTQIICTLPFTTLKLVEGIENLNFSREKKLAIFGSNTRPAFGMGTNSKTFLTFESRVWRQDNPGIAKNIGSVYGARGFTSQCFWESSRLQAGNRGILTNFVGGNLGLTATDAAVKRCLDDLNKMYNRPLISNSFQPATKALDARIGMSKQTVNWNKNPYTRGSYGAVLLGQWSTIIGALGTIEFNKRMFFAGEHTSLDYQGYMEGGFESGMRAANEVIASRKGGPVKDHYVWAKTVLNKKPSP